jgi:hypothetical protein
MNNDLIQEYINCAQDPVYFANNYGYVFDMKKQQVSKMSCFPYQEDCLRTFNDNQNSIVLKSRQMGLSVISAMYVAWRLVFCFDERILVVADNGNGAVRFLNTVRQVLDKLPDWMLPDERLINNTKQISFSNGSWVKAVASSKQAGRGESLTCLILDETAFIEHAQDIWMGAGLALAATQGKCIMISTPKGTGNLYHQTWVQASKGHGSFVPIKLHWSIHPILSEGLEHRKDVDGKEYPWSPWYGKECDRLHHDKVKISQELDLSFEGSSAVVIDNSIIMKYRRDIGDKKPICYFDFKKDGGSFVDYETTFHIWQMPKEDGNYIIGGDVGRGDSKDYSTLQIIDADSLEQVGEYQGKIVPDTFAELIYIIGLKYNTAFLAIECNSFGLATTLMLKNQLKYPNDRMYISKSAVKLFNRSHNYVVEKDTDVPGFQTTVKTRPLLVSAIVKYMRDMQIKINSDRLLMEFETFIYNGDKVEHAPGFNDDLIFAFAIALLIRDTEFESVFWNKQKTMQMLDLISHSKNDINSLGLDGKDKESWEDDDDWNDTNWLFGPIKG